MTSSIQTALRFQQRNFSSLLWTIESNWHSWSWNVFLVSNNKFHRGTSRPYLTSFEFLRHKNEWIYQKYQRGPYLHWKSIQ